ncbi:hypothetical protein FB451DRAFT_1413576 [Mycena latifolia]|nr:hypothetical protein FB451DRAFT_1413576 [Mycena latifolia]
MSPSSVRCLRFSRRPPPSLAYACIPVCAYLALRAHAFHIQLRPSATCAIFSRLGSPVGVGAIDVARAAEAPEDCLARVNERNRKANLEAVCRVEVLEAEGKRRERKNRVDGGPALVDLSARLRTAPQLFESTTPIPGTPNPATLGVALPPPKNGLLPSPAKTNGKVFEAAIIDSIEVDLGDF